MVIAAEPITDVDTTAAEMIEELDKELEVIGVELAFAEMKDPVKDRLQRYDLTTRIGEDRFFPTIGVAVKAFLDEGPGRVGGLGRRRGARIIVNVRALMPSRTTSPSRSCGRQIREGDIETATKLHG